MLYLHCGWPKTGTKSLQASLRRRRDELAAAGLVYPERWQGRWGMDAGSHNELVDLLRGDSGAAMEDFVGFLRAHAGEDVLLSCEAFTVFMQFPGADPTVFLAAVREGTPVTCVWTLRRFDEFRASLYLQLDSMGFDLPSCEEFVRDSDGDSLFAAMRRIEDCVDHVGYVAYDPAGGHNRELMRRCAVPAPLARSIEVELAQGPRLNVSPGPAPVVDAAVRRGVRERALRAAGRHGLDAYLEFFSDAEGPRSPSGPEEDLSNRSSR